MAHLEYILFNLLVLIGPVSLSFEAKIRYVRRWPAALCAAALMMIPFAIWDALVTGRHWWFNPRYTAGTFIGSLPLGEWLFFITVPFASLFVWEVLSYYRVIHRPYPSKGIAAWLWLGLIPALWAASAGKEYTALALLALVLIAQADRHLGGHIIERFQLWPYLAILALLMLLFNGYLTARPIVLYDPAFQLNCRIITIPLEDFIYGYSLILGCTSIYVKIRSTHE